MEKDIRTLRGKVNSVEACAQRFKEAEALAQGLFTGEGCVPLPYFTPHDETHCLAVEDYLDNIIWGGGKPGEHDFVPTAEEAMYLLSAVWLHDVGMMYGIREGEDVKSLADPTVVMEIRRDHEVRAVRYVHEVWKKDCEWSDDEKTSLTSICAYHRRHRSIGDFEPVRIAGKHDGKSVRLIILAALLRLADACHEDQSRAPGSLLARYFSLGMPDEAAVHWQKAKLITTIKFDHASRRITVVGQCPPKFDFGLVLRPRNKVC